MSRFVSRFALLIASALFLAGALAGAQSVIPSARIGGTRIYSGSITLDGSNPSSVATGLATVTSCQATLKATATPGDDPSWVSVNINGTSLDLYAYKNTGGTDPTLVASTNNTAVFYVTCVGT